VVIVEVKNEEEKDRRSFIAKNNCNVQKKNIPSTVTTDIADDVIEQITRQIKNRIRNFHLQKVMLHPV
jgi:hypothetical protein